jgi:Fe2+ or Zn2+ uptake regulation protein
MKPTEKKVAAALSRRGYKLTPQRQAVLKVIARSGEHLTPAAVYEQVRRVHPRIGLVTVYRTIELLVGLGFVRRVHAERGCHSYTATPPGHYHQLICSGCGAVVDFSGYDLSKLEQSLAQRTGFKIESHLLEFSGLCQNCQKAAA